MKMLSFLRKRKIRLNRREIDLNAEFIIINQSLVTLLARIKEMDDRLCVLEQKALRSSVSFPTPAPAPYY